MPDEELFKDTEPVSEDLLSQLSKLCNSHEAVKLEVKSIEEALREKKNELENISRNLIPTIFNSVNLSKIRLNSGEDVEVQDKVKSSITKGNISAAYRNMINEEGGDEEAQRNIDSLFKSELVIENASDDVLDLLLDKDIPYENKKSIHHSTLNKYCREKLEKGESIPEGISVFEYQETKIK